MTIAKYIVAVGIAAIGAAIMFAGAGQPLTIALLCFGLGAGMIVAGNVLVTTD